MTQMGLDYQKHLETKRHNLVSENIDKQDADTRRYTASFEERKVQASEKQADAAKVKADEYSRELDIKQNAVDATNRGNTLKYLSEQYLSYPGLGKITLALPFLLAEGLITKDEANVIKMVLGDAGVSETGQENAEKFRKGKTTAWANPTMGSFR